MCGVAGLLVRTPDPQLEELCSEFASAITHRGPDSSGTWSSDYVALGSVRLAVVDPVVESNQPMRSKDGRYVLVFNGEIYNFRTLRSELIKAGTIFRTNSDTEVVLESFLEWGVASFSKFNGMWSIAIWDSQEELLICSRDRFGKKPFHWALDSNVFRFSSEIKSFLGDMELSQNMNYFYSYFHNQGIDARDTTPFNNVYSLAPGSYLSVKKNLEVNITNWWEGFPSKRLNTSQTSNFKETFLNAVEIRLPEKQKFALSLSGGIDSSAVAAMTRQILNKGNSDVDERDIKCYTVNFGNSAINELDSALRTAEILGFEHETVEVDLTNFRRTVQEITWHQESLVWTSAAVSFRALYKAISLGGNKVALEGHGSDEYLAGYPNYARVAMLDNLKHLQLRAASSDYKLLKELSNQAVGEGTNRSQFVSETRNLVSLGIDRLLPNRKILRDLSNLQGIFTDKFADRNLEQKPYISKFSGLQAKLDKAVHFETLPQILRVFDRIAMAESVESRMPFMDYRLMNIAFEAGPKSVLNASGSKAILRDALSEIIPQHILNQKRKQGFSGDENNWYQDERVLTAFESVISDRLIYEIPGIDPSNYKKALTQLKERNNDPLLQKSIWLGFSYSIWYSMFFLGEEFEGRD